LETFNNKINNETDPQISIDNKDFNQNNKEKGLFQNGSFNKAFYSLFSETNDNYQLSFFERLCFWDYDQILTLAIVDQIDQAYKKAKYYNIFCCLNEIIKLEENNSGDSSNLENLWIAILDFFKLTIRNFVSYIKILPGLTKICQKDLEKLVKDKLFEFFIMVNLKQFRNDNCYIILPNGQQLNNILIEKLIGYEFLRTTFKIVKEITKLNMSSKEIALFLPFILTNFGKNVNQII
jgi:hypothetical protein